ncbi:hypothetical protein TYRP_013448 [Tyrophagus putrescentiae]|nr:hypothetical protein TYRP_013448 [Tyrophagus putrescentiae]
MDLFANAMLENEEEHSFADDLTENSENMILLEKNAPTTELDISKSSSLLEEENNSLRLDDEIGPLQEEFKEKLSLKESSSEEINKYVAQENIDNNSPKENGNTVETAEFSPVVQPNCISEYDFFLKNMGTEMREEDPDDYDFVEKIQAEQTFEPLQGIEPSSWARRFKQQRSPLLPTPAGSNQANFSSRPPGQFVPPIQGAHGQGTYQLQQQHHHHQPLFNSNNYSTRGSIHTGQMKTAGNNITAGRSNNNNTGSYKGRVFFNHGNGNGAGGGGGRNGGGGNQWSQHSEKGGDASGKHAPTFFEQEALLEQKNASTKGGGDDSVAAADDGWYEFDSSEDLRPSRGHFASDARGAGGHQRGNEGGYASNKSGVPHRGGSGRGGRGGGGGYGGRPPMAANNHFNNKNSKNFY